MSYLAVDDVDARVAKALKDGAKLMKPIFEVPGVGRIAILMQPGGAGVGWMTPPTERLALRRRLAWNRTASCPRRTGPRRARRFSPRRRSSPARATA
jgi:hypothetical protein